MSLSDTIQDTALLDGAAQLRDERAAVDPRFGERLTGRPIALTTRAEHFKLAVKRAEAYRYMYGEPRFLVARRRSEIALLSHRALPSASR